MNIKQRAAFAGVSILVAYGVLVSFITQFPIAVMLADVMSGLAVVGIAVIFFPLFTSDYPKWAISYLALKILGSSNKNGNWVKDGLLLKSVILVGRVVIHFSSAFINKQLFLLARK